MQYAWGCGLPTSYGWCIESGFSGPHVLDSTRMSTLVFCYGYKWDYLQASSNIYLSLCIYIYLCSGYLRFVTCCRKILAAMFFPLMADLLHQDRQLDTFETRVPAFDFPAPVLRAKGLGTPTAAVNGGAACCERSCTMQKHDISETTVLTILRF